MMKTPNLPQESTPFISISLSRIQQILLEENPTALFETYYFTEIDSTQRFLKELVPQNRAICCAEKQTAGRGRFGRTWHSPFGENIYLSLFYPHVSALQDLSGLSLVVSLAAHDCLKSFLPDNQLKIKWPNDLMWENKKLGGILIELGRDHRGKMSVMIGVGMNVNTDSKVMALSEKPACSLYDITRKTFDRNLIIAAFILQLETHLARFWQYGFTAFQSHWQTVDYLLNQDVIVHNLKQTLQGRCLGINETGSLLLQTTDGQIHALLSGETSLNKNEFKE